MNNLISKFGLLFSLLLLISCGKNPEKTLPSKDGKWELKIHSKVEQTVTWQTAPVITEQDCSGTATFTESKLTTTFGTSGCIPFASDWSYSDDKITLTGFPTTFEVTSKSAKKEIWHFDYTNGDVHTVQDWTLSR